MASNRKDKQGKGLEFMYPSANARGEPPDKKRRTDSNQVKVAVADNQDDLWDDDLDFITQDQLENIDFEISMSQQPVKDQSRASTSTSTRMIGRGTGRSHSTGNVISSRPQLNSSHTGDQSRIANDQIKSATKPLTMRNAPSTLPVHNSKTSVPFQNFTDRAGSKGSTDTTKSKLSLNSATSNRFCPPPKPQCASTSSIKSQLTPLTGSTGSGQFSPALPHGQAKTEFSDITQQQMLALQKELAATKEEYERTKNLNCQKEGEVNMLRNLLQESKLELSNTKQEQIKIRDQHKMEQTEKEKHLVQEVDRLKTQVQFAERDRDELQTRCKWLEKRPPVVSGASESLNSPLLSQTQSPQRRSIQETRSPRTPKGNFPNRVTFMADESTSKTRSPLRKPTTEERRACSSEAGQPLKSTWGKSFIIDIANERGRVSGPALVSQMLPRSTANNTCDQGIVGLLHIPQTMQDPHCTSVSEETADNALSKAKRWIQNLRDELSEKETDTQSPVITHNYYSLAIQAVSNLLNTQPTASPTDLLQDSTEEAVFLLPVIESYISHYVDQLRVVREPSGSGNSSTVTSLSSSLDSYDSLSSHQKSLARESASYIHQVEQWALNALHILYVLTDFSPNVRLALFGKTARDKQRANSDGTVSTEDKVSSDEASDESISSPNPSLIGSDRSTARIVRKCRILEHLMCTANPVLPNNKVGSTDVIEISLQILSLLASNNSPQHLIRFGTLLRRDILQACLAEDLTGTSEQRLRCHLNVLNLVKSLSRSANIVPLLASGTEDCLMCTLYTCVASPPQGASPDYRIKFGSKLIQVLSSILSHHVSGMTTLLESDCQCACEVVKTVTQLLYHVLHEHRASPSIHNLPLLHQGAVLLATLMHSGRPFAQQRREIENQYIEVVIGLHVIFKDTPDSADYDEIIQTLWDFDVEYNQDMEDSDEAMDTT